MSFDTQLLHRLTIERATGGAVDDYNQPTRTWSTLSEVPGLVQPKTAREMAALSDAGAVASTYTIYLRPTDIEASDRVRVADGNMAGLYQVDGIRDAAGHAHHLELDARQVVV